MALPHLSDRGDRFQIWKVEADLINKQTWRAEPTECGFSRFAFELAIKYLTVKE
jgi:hypothetical protein